MLLSLLTTGMHQACPGSKVIWYDSVTVDGELKWQNSLNQLNQYVRVAMGMSLGGSGYQFETKFNPGLNNDVCHHGLPLAHRSVIVLPLIPLASQEFL